MRRKFMIFLSIVFIACAVAIFVQTYRRNNPTLSLKFKPQDNKEISSPSTDVLSAVQSPDIDVSSLEVNRYIISSITDTQIVLKDTATNETIPYGLGQEIIVTDKKGQSHKVSMLDKSYINKIVTVLTDTKLGKNSLIISNN